MTSDYVSNVARLTRIPGYPFRTALIRTGIVITAVAGLYLVLGIAGVAPMPIEELAWNNIRIVAGSTIAGCLMAAIGYRNR